MAKGSCLCGDVTWELRPPFEWTSHCHCARCRKSHGAAFATYTAAPADQFAIRGLEHTSTWSVSGASFVRRFCKRCGSIVPSDPVDGVAFVPTGNFLDDPGVQPIAHIFVASKAPWYTIRDQVPQFDAYPPGIDAAVLPDRPPVDPPGQGVRGSCLCGAVAFVLNGQPLRAANCYCGRCRRARSAAHASNLFLNADDLRFTRGEEHLGTYKVPEAERFTQVFCTTCGSAMPRVDRTRGWAVVPMGCLDDDPKFPPQMHIFVNSKAPWCEIADDLPQHPESPG